MRKPAWSAASLSASRRALSHHWIIYPRRHGRCFRRSTRLSGAVLSALPLETWPFLRFHLDEVRGTVALRHWPAAWLTLEGRHNRTDALDCDLGILGLAVPDPPVQALDF